MQTVFTLRDVSYGNILFIPSLDIVAGSLFGITGKSGSGKTTLLKLLNNLVNCDRGEVLYYGKNVLVYEPVELRRKVLMIPQAPYIFPGTVLENIRLAFYFNRKEAPPQDEMEEMMSAFEMEGMLNRDTSNLSGGEKQRLALVRVLLLEPETLLLDEPTAALDEDNATTVVTYLARWVRKPGKSVVMISHAGSLVSDYAGTILDLSGGRISSLKERRGANV